MDLPGTCLCPDVRFDTVSWTHLRPAIEFVHHVSDVLDQAFEISSVFESCLGPGHKFAA